MSLFITLEGPDGSGKTYQTARLAEFLVAAGYDVLVTREPGGTGIGDQIRSILFNLDNTAMHPRTETLLFLAARAQLVEQVICPHLGRGGVVISDRYADSTLAYQGYGHGSDLEKVRSLLEFATGGLVPGLTLLLDIDAEEGLKRRSSSGGWNRLDAYNLEFHCRVREGYHCLAQGEPERWVVIDAGQPPEQVQQVIRKVVMERIGTSVERKT
jgi:dTMP kinase